MFQLAVAVLRDDFQAAASLMKLVSIGEQLKANDYRDWPLFKEFRKSQIFIDAYQSIYGHGLPVLESHLADQLFGSLSGVMVQMKPALPEADKQATPKQIEDKPARNNRTLSLDGFAAGRDSPGRFCRFGSSAAGQGAAGR